MIKTFTFEAFGVKYRSKQFAAIQSLAIMNDPETAPEIVLAQTEALTEDGHWASLGDRDAINAYILDDAEALPPQVVLRGILRVVGDHSFGFLRSWRGAKVPRRFLSQANNVSSENVDSIIVSLITDKMATMRELEEYYSLEDAFKMFDSMVVKGINSALGTEAAMSK